MSMYCFPQNDIWLNLAFYCCIMRRNVRNVSWKNTQLSSVVYHDRAGERGDGPEAACTSLFVS